MLEQFCAVATAFKLPPLLRAAPLFILQSPMAPKSMKAMKAMKGGTPMSKGAIAKALATAMEMKKSEATKLLDCVAEIGTKETVNVGKFTLPGLVMIKTKVKPATKAGKKMMFGEWLMVKAKPEKTVVKAYPAAALKKSF